MLHGRLRTQPCHRYAPRGLNCADNLANVATLRALTAPISLAVRSQAKQHDPSTLVSERDVLLGKEFAYSVFELFSSANPVRFGHGKHKFCDPLLSREEWSKAKTFQGMRNCAEFCLLSATTLL
jgi:hypothetical protein